MQRPNGTGERVGLTFWAMALVAGACLHSAVLHASRLARAGRGAHASTALLCLLSALYLLLLPVAYQSGETAVAEPLLRIAALIFGASLVVLAWAVRNFAARGPGSRHYLLLAAWLGLVLAELALPNSPLLGSDPQWVVVSLPWGEGLPVLAASRPLGMLLMLLLMMLCLLSALLDLHRSQFRDWGTPARVARFAVWALLVVLALIVVLRASGRLAALPLMAPAFGVAVLALAWSLRTRQADLALDRRERDALRLRHFHALTELSQRPVDPRMDEGAAIDDIVQAARDVLAVDRVSLWRLQGVQGMKSCRVVDDRGEHYSRAMMLAASAFPHYFERLLEGSVLSAPDSASDPRFAELREPYMLPMAVRSTLDVAIRSGGAVVGLVCIESIARRRDWDDDEIAFAMGLASAAGARWAALWQARSTAVLSALAGTSERGSGWLILATRQLARLFDADIAFVAELEPDGRHLRTLALIQDGAESPALRRAIEHTACAEALAGRSISHAAHAARLFPQDPLLAEHGIEGYVAAPFQGGSVRGLVVALRRAPLLDDTAAMEAVGVIAARIGAEIERERAEARMRQIAYVDKLTGLATRSALAERIAQELVTRRGHAALLIVDLDHFKLVNDALSHEVGDGLLRRLGRSLQAALAPGEFAARLGGDEFALLMPAEPGLDEVRVMTRAAVLLSIFDAPVTVGERSLAVGASVGAARFDADVGSVSDVMRRAEMALYRAKAMGRGRAELYQAALEAEASRRLAVQEGLRQAVERDELSLHLQPKVHAEGRLSGAECLMRWTHARLGPVSPAEFIPIAEETGLVSALGLWAVREACRIQHHLREALPARPTWPLAVNVSAWQLARPDFVNELQAAVQAEGGDPATLSLEITESLLLHDLEDVVAKLRQLRALGFRIALDDFGTGYSSLSYLRQLPLDELKIDRAFVAEIGTEVRNPLVHSMVSIGKHLGLSVVAEGVETPAQAEQLAAIGCDAFQGYLYARPMPLDAFIDWARSARPEAAAEGAPAAAV